MCILKSSLSIARYHFKPSAYTLKDEIPIKTEYIYKRVACILYMYSEYIYRQINGTHRQ